MYKIKKQNAITLISLVITILLLIILAGITINMTLGDNGIFTKAKNAKKMYDIERIAEVLELQKGEVGIENNLKANLSEYIEHIQKNEILKAKDILDPENIENGKCYIRMEEKYYYLLEQDKNDIKITYVENPFILKLETIKTGNNIEVIANLYDVNLKETSFSNTQYEYYIKKENEEYGQAVITNNKRYIYQNLDKDCKYYIKVKVKAEEREFEIEKWVIVGTTDVPTIKIENENIWKKEKNITISGEEGYKIKYTLDGTMPNATNGQDYVETFTINNNNTIITARYVDSSGKFGSGTTNIVTKIDNLPPTGNIIIEKETTNNIRIIVNANDNEETDTSGKSQIRGYYYSEDGGKNYTEITTNSTHDFSKLSQSSNYNIKVKIEDNAGNIAQIDTIGNTIPVPNPTIIVENANAWSKEKNVTISTTTGYTTKYTIDGTIPTGTNGTTYTGTFKIKNNCTIIAVYMDSTNQVSTGTTNTITKIDAIPPETLNINLMPSKKSIKVDITAASDSMSGIDSYRFSKDNGATWTNYQTGTSYTFDNLYGNLAGQTYTIIVEAKDRVGNTKQVAKNSTTTCLNTTYYKNYTFNLCTINGRKYYKTSSEGTINAVVYYRSNDHWINVLSIGSTESSVSTTCDYDNRVHNKWTINYNGTIYYCSASDHSMPYYSSISSNVVVLNSYNSEFSSINVEACKALLDIYFQ